MTAEALLQEILDRWSRGEIYSDEMKAKIEKFLKGMRDEKRK
jgi:hypothetical protein